MNRNLKPETIEKIMARRRANMERLDELVLDALRSLGGKWQGRIMVFRRFLKMDLREAQIKETLKRLSCNGRVKVTGEKNSAKGNTYEVLQ